MGNPTSELVRVAGFAQAQPLVPFPVHEVGAGTDQIDVRPATTDSWATVRSEHSLGGAHLRVKQYAMDWLGHFSAPNKLYSTRTGRWALYGPTAQIPFPRGT